MTVLFLDCFAGFSGAKAVGALCDLGVKPSTLEWELSKVDLGDFHMHFERRHRDNLEGVAFSIHAGATHGGPEEDEEVSHEHAHEHEHGDECGHHHHHHHDGHAHAQAEEGHLHTEHEDEPEHEQAEEEEEQDDDNAPDHEHGDELMAARRHQHEAGHHPTRKLPAGQGHRDPGHSVHRIETLIRESELSDFVKQHAQAVFKRIAEADAKVSGRSEESQHSLEGGMLSSIANVICFCAGLEELKVEAVYFSTLQEGSGLVAGKHGALPLPHPVTLELLTGAPVAQTEEREAMITPVGASLVAEFAQGFGPMPELQVRKIGYGVGEGKLRTRPNVLRAVLGESAQQR